MKWYYGAMAESEIKWEAPEFENRTRDISWYWISIMIAAAIIAFAVWQRNFLFGIFIVIAEILVILWGNKTPGMIAFTLTERGVRIGLGKFHPFSEMENFSVDKNLGDEPWDTVVFRFHGKFKMPLMIKLPTEKLEEAEVIIKKVLEEIDYEPSFLDSLEKLIGF